MKWAKDRPSKPGYYWYRGSLEKIDFYCADYIDFENTPIIVCVEEKRFQSKIIVLIVSFHGISYSNELNKFDGEWSEIIQEPENE